LFQQIIPQTFKTTAMSTIEKKSLSVGKYVNTEHVDTAIRNYKQERWVQNSERLGKADSMSVWYSAEELQGFIDTIREHGGDGVRMYFGAYGEKAPKAEQRTKRKDQPQGSLYYTRRKINYSGLQYGPALSSLLSSSCRRDRRKRQPGRHAGRIEGRVVRNLVVQNSNIIEAVLKSGQPFLFDYHSLCMDKFFYFYRYAFAFLLLFYCH
jgi:hypothetical protein